MKVIADDQNAERLAHLDHVEVISSPKKVDTIPTGSVIYQHGPFPGEPLEWIKRLMRRDIVVKVINNRGEIV